MVRKGGNQMALNPDCKVVIHSLPVQMFEGFQRVGCSVGTGVVVQQQNSLWKFSFFLERIAGFNSLWSMSQYVALVTIFPRSWYVSRIGHWKFDSGALYILRNRAAIFKYFNPLIHDSTRENFIPIFSTHAEMNLCSRHTWPQKANDWWLFPFDAIYKFRSHSTVWQLSYWTAR
jgi:hypothetical protein